MLWFCEIYEKILIFGDKLLKDEIFIVFLQRNNGQAVYWSAEESLMRYPTAGFLIDYCYSQRNNHPPVGGSRKAKLIIQCS